MACYHNMFRNSMTVFASCMKHHTSERNSCHLNRLLIYDYAWLARMVAGALTQQTSKHPAVRHAQTHYRPFKYTYSPNIHRTTFIKQLPRRIWMHSAINQWAHSRLLIVTNNERASARTADTDTWAFRKKMEKSGFDAKCHNLAALPTDPWQKTTVIRIQRRVGKNEGLQIK